MLIKRGIPVSPGVVSGPALVLGAENFRIPQRYVGVDAVEVEIARFQSALKAVCDEISENEQLATSHLGKQYGAIFAAHLQLVQDPKLTDEIIKLIRDRHFSPEFASSRVLRRYAKMFQNLGNIYLADRADDIFDLEKRILRHLLGERREELGQLTAPVIILAHNLTPGETATLPKNFVLGFATESGGRTSHTAILLEALEIPAVVGAGDFIADVGGGETVVIDGTRGEIIIDPDEETLGRYRDSQARQKTVSERLKGLRQQPSQTRDGVRIQLMGNIEFPEEIEHCTQRGADGIGLYRTEFLFLQSGREPTEEDHYAAYSRVVGAFPKNEVVIRTLDLGADKYANISGRLNTGVTSQLGLRSLRLTLQNLPLFKTQLRAYSSSGDLGTGRHYVSAGLVAPGTSPGEDDSGGRQGRSGGSGSSVQKERPGRYDGRGSVGRPFGRRVCQGGRFLLDRHERPDPVHSGGRPVRSRCCQPVQFG